MQDSILYTRQQNTASNLEYVDITALDVNIVLSKQPLIPAVWYNDISQKLPKNMKFTYAPFHPIFMQFWSRLIQFCCMVPITNEEELKLAFVNLHGAQRGEELGVSVTDNYISSLDQTTILPTGLTEYQSFWTIIIPTIQRAIINLPNSLKNDCNWGDHTLFPCLHDISPFPSDVTKYFPHNPFDYIINGMTVKEMIDELTTILAPEDPANKNSSDPSILKNKFDIKPQDSLQSSQNTVKSSSNNQTSRTKTPEDLQKNPQTGFFFSPSLSKLILSRRTVMGLMAVGFFGCYNDMMQNSRNFSHTYVHLLSQSELSNMSDPLCTVYPLNDLKTVLTTSNNLDVAGSSSEEYPDVNNSPTNTQSFNADTPEQTITDRFTVNGPILFDGIKMSNISGFYHRFRESSAVLAKMKAIMGYFMYFSLSPRVDAPSTVNTGCYHNVNGVVEYCWKQQGIQVDYILDSFLGRNSAPLGATRNGVYINQPKLISINEFINVFDCYIRSPATPITDENKLNRLLFCYNYIYAAHRYNHGQDNNASILAPEITDDDISSIMNNRFRRWLYQDNCLSAFYLLLLNQDNIKQSGKMEPLLTAFIGHTNLDPALSTNKKKNSHKNFKILQNEEKEVEEENTLQPRSPSDLLPPQTYINTAVEFYSSQQQNRDALDCSARRNLIHHKQEEYSYLQYDPNYPTQLQSLTPPSSTHNPILAKFKLQSTPPSHLPYTLLADFASSHIGGGTLRVGCVAEEMLFAEHAETCLTLAFCARMHHNATIQINNIVNHSILGGYSRQTFHAKYMFAYDNMFIQKEKERDQHTNSAIAQYDPKFIINYPSTSILAYDSYKMPPGPAKIPDQISLFYIARQLNKLFSGLTPTITYNDHLLSDHVTVLNTNPTIFTTGNWGCGVFQNNPQCIFLLQLIATRLCDQFMRYSNYGDKRIAGVYDLINLLVKNKGTSVISAQTVLLALIKQCVKDPYMLNDAQIEVTEKPTLPPEPATVSDITDEFILSKYDLSINESIESNPNNSFAIGINNDFLDNHVVFKKFMNHMKLATSMNLSCSARSNFDVDSIDFLSISVSLNHYHQNTHQRIQIDDKVDQKLKDFYHHINQQFSTYSGVFQRVIGELLLLSGNNLTDENKTLLHTKFHQFITNVRNSQINHRLQMLRRQESETFMAQNIGMKRAQRKPYERKYRNHVNFDVDAPVSDGDNDC